jgi:O-antigen ligase
MSGPGRDAGEGAMRVARGCVLVVALALPFSIAVTEGALVLGLAALLVARARGRVWTHPRSWLGPASLALVGAWLLASAFSAEPAASLWNVRKLYALGLVWLAAEALRTPAARRRVVPLILAGASLTALVGFVIYAVKVQRDPGYRLQSLLSNQMTSGGVLAAAFLWGLGSTVASRGWRRVGLGAALLPIGAALALTQTRSHWMGAAAGTVVVLAALAPRALWGLAAGGGLVAALAPQRLGVRLASIVDPTEPGNAGRLSMWRSGLDILRDHPLVGAGCQDLLSLYRRYRHPDWTFESGHFHNNVVQMAVMAGLVGLAAWCFWVVAALRVLVRGLRAAAGEDRGLAASALAVCVALLVGGIFDFTFGDAEVVYQTYLGLGIALALAPARADTRSVAAGRP